jgi:hypothetical protein
MWEHVGVLKPKGIVADAKAHSGCARVA